MTHTCDDCGETFKTLTRKRLHDCEQEFSVGSHDIDDDLPPVSEVLVTLPTALPKRFLVMPEAAQLDDDPALGRFFPILSTGKEGRVENWNVGIGYIDTGENHVIIGYNGQNEEWVIIENRGEPKFSNSEDELAHWLVENNNIEPRDVIGYDSGDSDYPEFNHA